MRRSGLLRFIVGLSLAFLPQTAELRAQQSSGVRELDEAKALYREARLAECVTRLDAAIEKLRGLPPSDSRKRDLADAHLFLGLSKLALNERASAKAALVEVVRLDRERRLDPEVYAPKVVELFEEAKREAGAPAAAGSGEASSPKTKKGSALPYILFGTAGAAAAGVAVARGGVQAVPSPSPSPSPSADTSDIQDVVFVGSNPPAGSTISFGSTTLQLTFSVTYPVSGARALFVNTVGSNAQPCVQGPAAATFTAGRPQIITFLMNRLLPSGPGGISCQLPNEILRLDLFTQGPQANMYYYVQSFNVRYTFVP